MLLGNWWTESFYPFLQVIVPVLLWMGFWLFAVNWHKVWPTLRVGAWAPFVLLIVITAIAWSSLSPAPCTCMGFMSLPNFWWQLYAVCGLAALALFAGWLQGVLGYSPVEVPVESPAHHAEDHGHGGHHEHH
jgi:hypothetical protein